MIQRKAWRTAMLGALLLFSSTLGAAEISVDGGPVEPGYNSGTLAYIHATVHGLSGKPKRYVVFAEIQYYGTTASASVELDRQPETKPGVEEFQSGWPIPPQAPTGLYTVSLHVDDRIEHVIGITKRVGGFVVYKKLVRISRLTFDKTVYEAGEPLQCEVGLENLSDTDMKGLRIELSSGSYPWISLVGQKGHGGSDLAVMLLRDGLDIPAGSALTLPMAPAGTARFSLDQQANGTGSRPTSSDEKQPKSEVETYAAAVWNAEHSILYDMQFAPPVMVRTAGSGLPKPASRNFTHPQNFDWTRLREKYGLPQASATGKLSGSASGEAARNQLPASLLVVCPREEDVPADAGLLRTAVESNVPVQVLLLVAGSLRECDRAASQPCGPNQARAFALARIKEFAHTLQQFGIPRGNMWVLGLPEEGLGPIWSAGSSPYLSISLACDHAPYANAYRPNLIYAREEVIAAIRQIISDFHPAMIALAHSGPQSPDQRMANWLVIKACQELLESKGIDPQTAVLVDDPHRTDANQPSPYRDEDYVVHLSDEAAALKQELTLFYQPQDDNAAVHKIKPLAELAHQENHLQIVGWPEYAGWDQESGH